MDIKSKTSLFIVGFIVFTVVVVGGYDVYAIMQGGTEATISFMIYNWSYKYPIFTFACGFFPGVLVGHFFWRIRDTDTTKVISEDSRK